MDQKYNSNLDYSQPSEYRAGSTYSGGGAGVLARNEGRLEPRAATFLDRASNAATQLEEINNRLSCTLERIRGSVPSSVDKDPAKTAPQPTLDSTLRALDRLLCRADELAHELDSAF